MRRRRAAGGSRSCRSPGTRRPPRSRASGRPSPGCRWRDRRPPPPARRCSPAGRPSGRRRFRRTTGWTWTPSQSSRRRSARSEGRRSDGPGSASQRGARRRRGRRRARPGPAGSGWRPARAGGRRSRTRGAPSPAGRGSVRAPGRTPPRTARPSRGRRSARRRRSERARGAGAPPRASGPPRERHRRATPRRGRPSGPGPASVTRLAASAA